MPRPTHTRPGAKSFKSLRLGGTQPFHGQSTALVVHVTFELPVFGHFRGGATHKYVVAPLKGWRVWGGLLRSALNLAVACSGKGQCEI